MNERDSFASHNAGLASVLRRFPSHSAQIHTLIERNENFRTVCEDLACAERALLGIDQLPKQIRVDRKREFTVLIDELAVEIERMLAQIKVISFIRKQ